MNTPAQNQPATLAQARALVATHQTLRAELLYRDLVRQIPFDACAVVEYAEVLIMREAIQAAFDLLHGAFSTRPEDALLCKALSTVLQRYGHPREAIGVLEQHLRHAPAGAPQTSTACFALGELRKRQGDSLAAARAWHRALQGSDASRSAADASSGISAAVIERAREEVRQVRQQYLVASYSALRDGTAGGALDRIDRCVASMVGASVEKPPDPRQRPKFMFVPSLPAQPYLDPRSLGWTEQLSAAFPQVRREAQSLMESGEALPPFLASAHGDAPRSHLGGDAAKPEWNAFFFYRHGRRYDDNHARCPATSRLIDSLDLFKIPGQSPEICFSFLAPRTSIKPHFGVSNARLVLHLPLIVPPDCALNLVGIGEHVWEEGRCVLFDDTYEHEAWNRSDLPRVVLLLDCWNPALSPVEREAISRLVQASSAFDDAF